MEAKQPDNNMQFLANGGEMGALIRAKDWSKTPLGPPDNWPQSLRTTISIILNSKFPMFLWWGPELICFYNDAYRPSLGQDGKHPSILGMRAPEAWTEIWDFIGPLIKQVMSGGEAVWFEDQLVPIFRNGKLEDVYWTFSYSPVNDGLGIAGVLVTVNETTEKVNTFKKLQASEQRFRTLVNETMVGTAVFSGKSMVLETANQVALDVWGKDSSVFGKPLLEFIPELKGHPFVEVMENIYITGKPFKLDEAIINFKRNGKPETLYVDFNFKVLRNEDGQVNGILGMGINVTEKVLIRKKLEESERKLRLIILQAPLSIAIFRGPTYITEIMNPRALELCGRKEEEVLNKPILGALPELLSQGIRSLLDRVHTTRLPFSTTNFPMQFMRNGTVQNAYLNLNMEPLYDVNGAIDGIIAVGVEVTEQVLIYQKIEENEERLKIIIEASELGTWEVNWQTDEVKYSDRYLEIFGHTKGTKPTRAQMIEHIYNPDMPARNSALEEGLKNGFLHYDGRVMWKDGTIRWIEVKGKVFYDENKKPLNLIGTIADITEYKDQQQKLLEREQKFRLLADSMPQHVWTSDIEGNLNYFNQSVYDYSGLTSEQINEVGWLEIVHPDDREENTKAWKEAISTGKGFLFEHRFRRHDGEYRWQLSRAIPQKTADGTIQMWVGTSTDIQEQKMFTSELKKQVLERTKELAQKNEALEKMNKELQSFTYISSHDLQEPLRKIQTIAQRIVEKEVDNLTDGGKDYFNRMQNAARRMQVLINDLLAYSRTNTQERKFEKVSLKKIVEEVKEDLAEEINRSNAIIETNEMDTLSVISFQFRQLLQNLISNSIKFTIAGQQPHIKIISEVAKGSEFNEQLIADQNYCHISISDNGIGFEPDYNEKIFELFQRLHGREQYSGTGLGLAIVKRIVENHNGIITAKGEAKKGATFDIYIPVK